MGVTSQKPSELFERESIWASSVASKLRELPRLDLAEPLETCHTQPVHIVCQACRHTESSLNHCDRFYCPMCTGRLAWRRRRRIEWWAHQVAQPKHLVLTIRNTNTLTKKHVKTFKHHLSRLRRSKLFSHVSGGLQSLEVTNEGRGWHLHAHLLLAGPYLPGADLAHKWARLVGQDFAIVKIKSVQDKAYLQEVTKYAVKGSELASWGAWEIATFIDSFTGLRAFSTFGDLYKDNALRERSLKELTLPSYLCDKCGCEDFWYLDQNEHDWFETTGKLPWQN